MKEGNLIYKVFDFLVGLAFVQNGSNYFKLLLYCMYNENLHMSFNIVKKKTITESNV